MSRPVNQIEWGIAASPLCAAADPAVHTHNTNDIFRLHSAAGPLIVLPVQQATISNVSAVPRTVYAANVRPCELESLLRYKQVCKLLAYIFAEPFGLHVRFVYGLCIAHKHLY